MIINKLIHLHDFYPAISEKVTLETLVYPAPYEMSYLRPLKAMLILPGGGYAYCSKREAMPIALRFASYGYACFILDYTVVNCPYPYPLLDAIAALDYIKKHADEYKVNANDVTAVGFSAGGHLCASLGAYSNKEEYKKMLGIEGELHLDAAILSYPVITGVAPTHEGTMQTVSSGDPKLREYFSMELHVDSSFPKTFLWTTDDDQAVPSISTKLMDAALKKAGVPHQTVIFSHGDHGSSLNNRAVYSESYLREHPETKVNGSWVDRAVNYLCGLEK